MTLTEFLLARISEDEADARGWPDSLPQIAPNGELYVDPHGHPIYAPRSRVLAECAAKRRIIAEHALLTNPFENRDYTAPYASHPEFLAAWGDNPS